MDAGPLGPVARALLFRAAFLPGTLADSAGAAAPLSAGAGAWGDCCPRLPLEFGAVGGQCHRCRMDLCGLEWDWKVWGPDRLVRPPGFGEAGGAGRLSVFNGSGAGNPDCGGPSWLPVPLLRRTPQLSHVAARAGAALDNSTVVDESLCACWWELGLAGHRAADARASAHLHEDEVQAAGSWCSAGVSVGGC